MMDEKSVSYAPLGEVLKDSAQTLRSNADFKTMPALHSLPLELMLNSSIRGLRII